MPMQPMLSYVGRDITVPASPHGQETRSHIDISVYDSELGLHASEDDGKAATSDLAHVCNQEINAMVDHGKALTCDLGNGGDGVPSHNAKSVGPGHQQTEQTVALTHLSSSFLSQPTAESIAGPARSPAHSCSASLRYSISEPDANAAAQMADAGYIAVLPTSTEEEFRAGLAEERKQGNKRRAKDADLLDREEQNH